jgi:hypothetical protein
LTQHHLHTTVNSSEPELIWFDTVNLK